MGEEGQNLGVKIRQSLIAGGRDSFPKLIVIAANTIIFVTSDLLTCQLTIQFEIMPAGIEDDMIESADGGIATLPFPPITKAHIMNCSYHSWHPRYICTTYGIALQQY
jgi:hypothetical protein